MAQMIPIMYELGNILRTIQAVNIQYWYGLKSKRRK